MTAHIGAEIGGVDLAAVGPETQPALHELWLRYKVLFFRDQDLSKEEHLAFGRLWGGLEVHPFAPDDDENPEFVVIESTPDAPYAAQRWHSDVTWRVEPSLGSILRARAIPPVGGDTCFSNVEAAYDYLSEEWKQRLEGLVAVHDFTRVFGAGVAAEERAAMRERYPVTEHPVIRTHPETGRKCIYTNRAFVDHIVDVSPDESEEILGHLERAVSSPNVTCRFRWEVDSVAMWDNRCTQHFATADFWPEYRRVERVTIAGDRPF